MPGPQWGWSAPKQGEEAVWPGAYWEARRPAVLPICPSHPPPQASTLLQLPPGRSLTSSPIPWPLQPHTPHLSQPSLPLPEVALTPCCHGLSSWSPHGSAVWSALLAVQGFLPAGPCVQTCLLPGELFQVGALCTGLFAVWTCPREPGAWSGPASLLL